MNPRRAMRRWPLARKALLLAAAAWLILVAGAEAFVQLTVTDPSLGRPLPASWPPTGFPIPYGINVTGYGERADGSEVTAILNAFEHWTRVPTTTAGARFTGFSPRNGPARDGVNLVSFQPGLLGIGFLAATIPVIDLRTGEILEADIVVNGPAAEGGHSFSTGAITAPATFDLEGILTHEVGHFFGLDHTGVDASPGGGPATMYAQIPGGRASQDFRSLEPDDVAGISTLYPTAAYASRSARIRGRVLGPTGSPLFGVHVLARNVGRGAEVVGTLTGEDGEYVLRGVPASPATPTAYWIQVEPAEPRHLSGFFSFPNLSFPPLYYPQVSRSEEATSLHVLAGDQVEGIDFVIQFPEDRLEPNDAPESAAQIDLPARVNATIEPAGDRDFFSFYGLHGQTIRVDVAGEAIGSRLDPDIRLIDPFGRLVARADDFDGLDPRLEVQLLETGEYLLEVRDFGLPQGGREYYYDLSLKAVHVIDFPYVEESQALATMLSLVNPEGNPARVDLYAFNRTGDLMARAHGLSLAPGGALRETVGELFPDGLPVRHARLRISSDSPLAASLTYVQPGASGRYATTEGLRQGGEEVVIPYFVEGEGVQSSLIVAHGEVRQAPEVALTVELLDSGGEPLAAVFRERLFGGGWLTVPLADLLGRPRGLVRGWVRVRSETLGALQAVLITRSSSDFAPLSVQNGTAEPARRVYLTRFADSGRFRTQLSVVNPGRQPVAALVTGFSDAGAIAGSPIVLTIPPSGSASIPLSSPVSSARLGQGGSFVVEADGELVASLVYEGTSSPSGYMTAEAAGRLESRIHVPEHRLGEDFLTFLVLFNPHQEMNAVTVRVFDDAEGGFQPSHVGVVVLQPNGRSSVELGTIEWTSGADRHLPTRGRLELTAPRPVVVTLFYFNPSLGFTATLLGSQ